MLTYRLERTSYSKILAHRFHIGVRSSEHPHNKSVCQRTIICALRPVSAAGCPSTRRSTAVRRFISNNSEPCIHLSTRKRAFPLRQTCLPNHTSLGRISCALYVARSANKSKRSLAEIRIVSASRRRLLTCANGWGARIPQRRITSIVKRIPIVDESRPMRCIERSSHLFRHLVVWVLCYKPGVSPSPPLFAPYPGSDIKLS